MLDYPEKLKHHIGRTYLLIGLIYYFKIQDQQNSLINLEQSLGYLEDNDKPNYCLTLSILSILYCAQGRFTEALKTVNSSLHLRKAIFGNDHLDIAASYNIKGSILRVQRKYDEALNAYIKSENILYKIEKQKINNLQTNNNEDDPLEIALQRFSSKFVPDLCNTYLFMSEMYGRLGQMEEALLYLHKTFESIKNFDSGLGIDKKMFEFCSQKAKRLSQGIPSLHQKILKLIDFHLGKSDTNPLFIV